MSLVLSFAMALGVFQYNFFDTTSYAEENNVSVSGKKSAPLLVGHDKKGTPIKDGTGRPRVQEDAVHTSYKGISGRAFTMTGNDFSTAINRDPLPDNTIIYLQWMDSDGAMSPIYSTTTYTTDQREGGWYGFSREKLTFTDVLGKVHKLNFNTTSGQKFRLWAPEGQYSPAGNEYVTSRQAPGGQVGFYGWVESAGGAFVLAGSNVSKTAVFVYEMPKVELMVAKKSASEYTDKTGKKYWRYKIDRTGPLGMVEPGATTGVLKRPDNTITGAVWWETKEGAVGFPTSTGEPNVLQNSIDDGLKGIRVITSALSSEGATAMKSLGDDVAAGTRTKKMEEILKAHPEYILQTVEAPVVMSKDGNIARYAARFDAEINRKYLYQFVVGPNNEPLNVINHYPIPGFYNSSDYNGSMAVHTVQNGIYNLHHALVSNPYESTIDITNFGMTDATSAKAGDRAQIEVKATFLPGHTTKIVWVDSSDTIVQTNNVNSLKEANAVTFQVPTNLDKKEIYTTRLVIDGKIIDADQFLADPAPKIKLHRNLDKDDKNITVVSVTNPDDGKVTLTRLADSEDYQQNNKYFVGWSTNPNATQPDKNALVDESKLSQTSLTDIYLRDGSDYKLPANDQGYDLYAVWKDPFTVKISKTWLDENKSKLEASGYDTSKLKFGLISRPAVGSFGSEVVTDLATYEPVKDAKPKVYNPNNADGIEWTNLPSYDKTGKRISYLAVELVNDKMVDAYNAKNTTWSTYNINIVPAVPGQNHIPTRKEQSVQIPKQGGTEVDTFTAATHRVHIVNGVEKDPHPLDGSKGEKIGYFDTNGYKIDVTNKKVTVATPKIEQAKKGAKELKIATETPVEKLELVFTPVGTDKVTFDATYSNGKWTIPVDNGFIVDDAKSNDKTLVLKPTFDLGVGDNLTAVAVKDNAKSSKASMTVVENESRLPKDIKQVRSDKQDKIKIEATPYQEIVNDAPINVVPSNTKYELVDENGDKIAGTEEVTANEFGIIAFEVPKAGLTEGKEVFIKVTEPGKDPMVTSSVQTVTEKPETAISQGGKASTRGVKVDITAPSVKSQDGKLPAVNGAVGKKIDDISFAFNDDSGTKITRREGPNGLRINHTDGNTNATISGTPLADYKGEANITVEDMFGNSDVIKGDVNIIPRVTDTVPDGQEGNYYPITFKADDHSVLIINDKEVGTYTSKYVLKDFNGDGEVDDNDNISLAVAKENGIIIPSNYKVKDNRYEVAEPVWNPDINADGFTFGPSKDNTFTLQTKLIENIIPVPNPDAKPDVPAGYTRVTIAKGDKIKILEGVTTYDVRKDGTVRYSDIIAEITKQGSKTTITIDDTKGKEPLVWTVDNVPVEMTSYPTNATTITADATALDKDTYAPTPVEQTVKQGEEPEAKNSIGNKEQLPDKTTYEFVDNKGKKITPNTDTVGTIPVKVKVTYPDKSSEIVDANIKVVPKEELIDVTDPNSEIPDGYVRFKFEDDKTVVYPTDGRVVAVDVKLGSKAIYADITNRSGATPAENHKEPIKWSRESKETTPTDKALKGDEVEKTLIVLTPKATPVDASVYNPTAKVQKVVQGDTPEAKNSIGNTDKMPAETTYKFVGDDGKTEAKVDTNTVGEKPAKVLVTFPDKSTKLVETTITVIPKDSIIDITDKPDTPNPEGYVKVTLVNDETSVNPFKKVYQVKGDGSVRYSDIFTKAGTLQPKDGYKLPIIWKDGETVVKDADKPEDGKTIKAFGTPTFATQFRELKTKKQTVNKGVQPVAIKSVFNPDQYPEETTYQYVDESGHVLTKVNTDTEGDVKVKVKANFPDGSSLTSDATITVEEKLGDIVPVPNPDKTDIPKGYARITLAKDATVKFDDNAVTTYDVKIDAKVRYADVYSKVNAEPVSNDYKDVKWYKADNSVVDAAGVITAAETITAKATNAKDIIPVEDPNSEVPAGYVRVTLGKDDTVTFKDGAKTVYDVKLGRNITINDVAKEVAATPAKGYKDPAWYSGDTKLALTDKVDKLIEGKTGDAAKKATITAKATKEDAKKSEDPTVNPVGKDDDKITGTGTPGSTITVVDKDGNPINGKDNKPITTTVGDDGNFEIPKDKLPDGKNPTDVYVNQKEKDKDPSDPVKVESKKLSDEHNVSYDTVKGIKGKEFKSGEPKFTNKKGDATTAPENTTFDIPQEWKDKGATIDPNTGVVTYTIPAEETENVINIPVTVNYNDGSKGSSIVSVSVTEEGKTDSATPELNPVKETDKDVVVKVPKGTNGDVVVTFPGKDGNTIVVGPVKPGEDGTVTVNVPENADMTPGKEITATYTEEGKNPTTTKQTILKVDDSEKYEPQPKNIDVKVGETPNAKDGIANGKDLPTNTTYEFVDNEGKPVKPDTTKPGTVPVIIKVTYPDGTSDKVNTNVVVTKPSGGGSGGTYTPTPTPKPTPGNGGRVSGNDRIETAIEISKKYFGKADTVIIVRNDLFPDSMTASVLSKLLKAPILLTKTDELDNRVKEEIRRLGAKEMIIVGGETSVSNAVREALKEFDSDKSVERIAGRDRYATSEAVARRVVGITGKKHQAVIASGEVFPDALAVGPFAAREGLPILLVKKDVVTDSVKKAVKDLDINSVYIAGGLSTVSSKAESMLPKTLERMSGRDRYETAVAIAKSKFAKSEEAFIANGEVFADALVISPVGGLKDQPILLVKNEQAPKSVIDYVQNSEIASVVAIGGRSLLPDSIIDQLLSK